ncbi:UNVERIFIED_CONTAM: Retrovirus-related Pol polyprotein from transposon.6 [Sesamum latifolium]|uniref:Retrovirus-related Pol polyprotein from transposon.6 n=1 Tax=Sesamum latifolium TaxID=2727402 RepID=A0AAW2X6E2_9LAMI
MKFPTKNGIGEVSCDQREAQKCYNLSLRKGGQEERAKRKEREETEEMEDSKKFKSERIEPTKEHKSIELVLGEPDKTTRIGSNMSEALETVMIEFLRRSVDMFAWSPSDFRGIDPRVIVHRLNVDPMMRPVKQKKRSFGAERNRIIEEDVNKLLEAGYVSEVQYTDWLANVVVVPKASGKWLYVDDMLVKSRKVDDHLSDLKQAFEIIRAYGMKLNPTKCTFGVRGGKFLGYMVSEKRIEANPEKIKAITRL